jgi:hypothetical protein
MSRGGRKNMFGSFYGLKHTLRTPTMNSNIKCRYHHKDDKGPCLKDTNKITFVYRSTLTFLHLFS